MVMLDQMHKGRGRSVSQNALMDRQIQTQPKMLPNVWDLECNMGALESFVARTAWWHIYTGAKNCREITVKKVIILFEGTWFVDWSC